MAIKNKSKSTLIRIFAIFMLVIGILTLKAGGSVILIGTSRIAAGNYVPYVLWFNFIIGFFHIIVAVGLWFEISSSYRLPLLILLAYIVVDIFFAYHIFTGGLYELKTVVAMSFRNLTWIGATIIAYKKLQTVKD